MSLGPTRGLMKRAMVGSFLMAGFEAICWEISGEQIARRGVLYGVWIRGIWICGLGRETCGGLTKGQMSM